MRLEAILRTLLAAAIIAVLIVPVEARTLRVCLEGEAAQAIEKAGKSPCVNIVIPDNKSRAVNNRNICEAMRKEFAKQDVKTRGCHLQ